MKFVKKYFFEILIVLLYIALMVLYPVKTISALKEGIMLFLKMLPLFICVTLFSAFLAMFVSKDVIRKYMGEESGLKGIVFGALFGTIIVGPLWVLFPMFQTFLEKGAGIAIIGAMIGAFAIKTPWLPYAAGFLGWPFVLVSFGLILVYSVIEGILMEKILK